ncbi:MAG TPA: aromatic amino acid ammonia-lyase [Cyclobacteriaceae bacterium]|jgi:histidine ammonia-lyase
MVKVGSRNISITDFQNILFDQELVELDQKAVQNVQANFDFLQSYSKDKVIYGINTGFGPMAQYRVDDEHLQKLQYNLIRSHSSGSGAPFTEELALSTMLCRLISLMRGYSGINPQLVQLLTDLINKRIGACIFEHGGVGASGDLVQLAHLALNLIGEGEMLYKGNIITTKDVFEIEGLQPIDVHIREGLALLNGTSAMTGVGVVNLIYAQRLLSRAIMMSVITNELMQSYDDHFSKELNQVKNHEGQAKVAEIMRNLLSDSKLIRKRPDHLYNRKINESVFKEKVQEYYSLRCVPQILGPVYDTLIQAQRVLENEINSVNDNPIVDHKSGNVFHGGNFHGDYISFEMDKIKIAVAKLSMLAERQLNYLLNNNLNQKLTPFVNLGALGLNFGIQGMQFTATSNAAENQTLSYPMYLHSISTNNDNQDIVSMGCNAALLTRKVIDNSFEILSVQIVALVQAIDLLQCHKSISSFTKAIYDDIRAIIPTFVEDEARYKELKAVKEYLMNRKSLKF